MNTGWRVHSVAGKPFSKKELRNAQRRTREYAITCALEFPNATHWMMEAERRGVVPSSIMMSEYMLHLTDSEDLDKAFQSALQRTTDDNQKAELYRALIAALIARGEMTLAARQFLLMRAARIPVLPSVFGTFISGFCKGNDTLQAHSWMMMARQQNVTLNTITGWDLLEAYVKIGDTAAARKLLHEFAQDKMADERSHIIVIDAFAGNGSVCQAESVFDDALEALLPLRIDFQQVFLAYLHVAQRRARMEPPELSDLKARVLERFDRLLQRGLHKMGTKVAAALSSLGIQACYVKRLLDERGLDYDATMGRSATCQRLQGPSLKAEKRVGEVAQDSRRLWKTRCMHLVGVSI
eukprot:TRINITY_DN11173_c0_g1_i1.p1 TRINITY_DN11173_c0_g1~~TRINITY_DN11173_c0_g1_i1.p1  ORF type:complete len:353 (-),score=42.33 TRINITY_DN11173_c0_g1_i1:90-1148(-)